MQLGVAFGGLSSLLSGANMLKMGMMAASAIGMYLLNGKKEKGEIARLSDLKVSSSSYGRGIPIVYGTMRVTGNMFWATDFDEVLKYTDPKGKGGKKGEKKGTPYYEYYANYAMCLCEGPVEEVLRIWADSNLIYDKYNPDNEDLVGPGFSRQEGSGGGKSGFGLGKKKGSDGGDSGRFKFRFYSGHESQMQDPFMVAKQGFDKVPAHRGMCYLFFERFSLMDFGNRVPTITAEVSAIKQIGLSYKVLENLPDSGDFNQPTDYSRFADPERYRYYSEETSSNGTTLRVYDISTDKEIRRLTNAEVAAINADNPDWGGSFNYIGIAGNGDLVILFGPSRNSRPIGFLDPNTFVLKKKFGTASSALNNGSNSIVWAYEAKPATYIELVVKPLSGSAEVEPKRATIVRSLGGNFYMFGEKHEPLGWFDLPGGASTYFGSPVQIEDKIFGCVFLIPAEHNSGNSAYMYRADVTFAYTSHAGPTGETYELVLAQFDSSIREVRHLTAPGAGVQTVRISGIQYILNLEEVVWFETKNFNDPLENGVYALAARWDDENLVPIGKRR